MKTDNINFRVIRSFNNNFVGIIKKLEKENLGKDAALNQWQIPVIIRYGKFITAENENGEIIGVCEALRCWDDKNSAFIHSFYVIRGYRSMGIGKKLLVFVLGLLRWEKFKAVKLTVDPVNIRAINLYRSLGFEIMETEYNEYGKGADRYLMKKEL